MKSKIRFLISALALTSSLFTLPSVSVAADKWPGKSMRVVVPYPAGGIADVMGRLVALKINNALPKTNVVVENLSGGLTIPATLSVLKARADGNTLYMASDNTLNINKWLLKNPRYDADADFVPVTVLINYPHWLVVKSDGPYSNFEEFFKYIQDNPGKASISVNTVGGAAYLALDNWRRENNLDFEIIPYRGSPPAITDLIGGLTDAHIDVVGSSIGHAKSGRVKPLIVMQPTPLKEMPEVPTQDFDDEKALTVRSNLSVVMKAGTDEKILQQIYEILNEAVNDPDFVESLQTLSHDAIMLPPEEAKEFLHAESQRYKKLVEDSGLEKQ